MLFSAAHFRHCKVAASFVEAFKRLSEPSNVPDEDIKEVGAGYLQQFDQEKTPVKSVLDSEGTLTLTPAQAKIDRKRIGKFMVPIKYIHTPEKGRRVRGLDDSFVLKLQKEMMESVELSAAAAPPLIGFIDTNKDEFSEEKLLRGEYRVEAIDGNHSLHAMRNLTEDKRFTEREVVIYGNITEDECQKLGIKRNKETMLSLKMTDYDWLILLRNRLLCLTGTDEPPEDIPTQFGETMKDLMELNTVST